ncbi:MAG: ABC transporter substrate-binding protein, partial [Dehalococcoidales bacterium]|nr:ABC transporter substrate-binding protein [Dehalococcoidales bacterium]
MKRNKWLTLLAAVSLVLLVVVLPIMSACGAQGETPGETPGQTPGQTPATTETKYIRIGNLNSCTGSYAASGLPMRNGFDIRLTMLNESGGVLEGGERYLIEPIYYDTRTDPKRGVAGILWMKDMYDIKMCVGPAESNISFATQPIFEANKIFTFTVSTANEVIRPGIQWTFAYMSMAGQRILGYVRTLKDILDVKKISMISENAAAYQSYRADMIKYCQSYGIEIISDIVFESSVTDFSTVIARARNGDPDMAIMMSTGMPGIRFLNQVHEAGWNVLVGVSPEIPTDETFRSCGPAA